MVLETLSCGDCSGRAAMCLGTRLAQKPAASSTWAVTNCGKSCSTCRDSMQAREWVELGSALSRADKCTGFTISLSSFLSRGQKMQGALLIIGMWKGSFLQLGSWKCPQQRLCWARLVSGLL